MCVQVTLVENAATSGVFTGAMPTAVPANAAQGLACDGTVFVMAPRQSGNSMFLQYMEQAPYSSAGRKLYWLLSWPGTINLSPSLSPVTSYIGDTLRVTVTDNDLAATGSLTVTVTAAARQFVLGLTPTGAIGPTVFTGSLALTGLPPLYGTSTSTAVAVYTDASHSMTRTASVSIAPSGNLTIAPFGDAISALTVTATDASFDLTDYPDSITVAVSSSVGGGSDTESLSLVETAMTSGVFTGTIRMARASAAASGDGAVQAAAAGTVTASYQVFSPLLWI